MNNYIKIIIVYYTIKIITIIIKEIYLHPKNLIKVSNLYKINKIYRLKIQTLIFHT
jgi:hypothetical protein